MMTAPRTSKKRTSVANRLFPVLIGVAAILFLQVVIIDFPSRASVLRDARSTSLHSYIHDKDGNRLLARVDNVEDPSVLNQIPVRVDNVEDSTFLDLRTVLLPVGENSNQTLIQTILTNAGLHLPIGIQKSEPTPLLNVSYIRDPLLHPSKLGQKIDLKSEIEYLGVLLDAGRHYFPTEWIYRLLDHLELLGFNLLHFRLTDDQAFNIRLDSRPEIAQPAIGSDGKVYTPTELRKIVAYAKQRGIVIMPEINVPGHAGGWAGGIPGLVVPCVGFICRKGYGLPLNVSHPQLFPLLRDVLMEVKQIFSTSPFVHLGGDELHMSAECFEELGVDFQDYDRFETDLENLLRDLDIPLEQVVRWEMTGEVENGAPSTGRAKGIDHFWYSRSYQDWNDTDAQRVFCSEGLYFDTNQEEDAWTIYKTTKHMRIHKHKPIAIVAGTFELGADYWLVRNVLGRLLAVAIGSSNEDYDDEKEFLDRYNSLCGSLLLPEEICVKVGAPMIGYDDFRKDWQETSSAWRENLCSRLAVKERVPVLSFPEYAIELNQMEANSRFWDLFATPTIDLQLKVANQSNTQHNVSEGQSMKIFKQHKVIHTGIILDLVYDGSYSSDKLNSIKATLDYLGQLGFNTVQLRIMNDYGFAIDFNCSLDLEFGRSTDEYTPWKIETVTEIVQHAASLGIRVIPEVTVAHRAGGWYKGAHLIQCPRFHCQETKGLTLETVSGAIWPPLSSILVQMKQAFTSQFLHLGYDEREESMGCLKEAMTTANFDVFEKKLARFMAHANISPANVLRWENEEGKVYERFGHIRHYRKRMPSKNESVGSFISTDLNLHDPLKLETAWDLYRHVQRITSLEPLGVLASVISVSRDFNTRQRLLALAMGLSIDNLEEHSFRKQFLDLCKAAKNKHCERFGVIDYSHKLADDMSTVEKRWRSFHCSTRLVNETFFRPREGILVENGTNTYAMKFLMSESDDV